MALGLINNLRIMSMSMSSREQVPHFQLCQDMEVATSGHLDTRGLMIYISTMLFSDRTTRVRVLETLPGSVGSKHFQSASGFTHLHLHLYLDSFKGCFHNIDSHVPSCFFCREKSTCQFVSSSELLGAEIKSKGIRVRQ